MDTRNYSTEGIIISRKNIGETDRLLTVFSKHYGKLRVVAKGVRRTISRKRGAIEIFSYCKFLIARGKNLDILTDVEIKSAYENWRSDLVRVGVAYHLCEVVNKLTAEHQEHKEVLYSLQECLESLSALDYWQLYPLVQNFKLEVLEELGFISKNKPVPTDVDSYIEDLIGTSLKTLKFLKVLSKK
ncbi:MAG: DNA repair protein RecO [Patescibacteria group bacterium]